METETRKLPHYVTMSTCHLTSKLTTVKHVCPQVISGKRNRNKDCASKNSLQSVTRLHGTSMDGALGAKRSVPSWLKRCAICCRTFTAAKAQLLSTKRLDGTRCSSCDQVLRQPQRRACSWAQQGCTSAMSFAAISRSITLRTGWSFVL
eukprot:1221414-Amphidinium_carterae.1